MTTGAIENINKKRNESDIGYYKVSFNATRFSTFNVNFY